jgi:hypothetical protein
LRLRIDAMPHRPALHEDDWLMTVLARDGAESPSTYRAFARRATCSKL